MGNPLSVGAGVNSTAGFDDFGMTSGSTGLAGPNDQMLFQQLMSMQMAQAQQKNNPLMNMVMMNSGGQGTNQFGLGSAGIPNLTTSNSQSTGNPYLQMMMQKSPANLVGSTGNMLADLQTAQSQFSQ